MGADFRLYNLLHAGGLRKTLSWDFSVGLLLRVFPALFFRAPYSTSLHVVLSQ